MSYKTGMIAEGKYAYGPGRFYIDTASGGKNLDAGPTNGITWEWDIGWLGLRSVDAGDRDDEAVVTFTDWIITTGLAKPTWEVLLFLHPGLSGKFDSSGALLSVSGVQARGWRTEDHRVQCTFKEYDPGTNIISTDPWRIVDFWLAAPKVDKQSLNWDASSQRFFPVRLQAKEDPSHLDDSGKPEAWKIRGDG